MRRIKMLVQYLGTGYSGWQVQKNAVTVQQVIQDAVLQALGEETQVHASGRTDAGVHAWAQCVHFDTCTRVDSSRIFEVINAHLPNSIRALSSEEVSDDFHARFDVKRKTYEYHFYVGRTDLPLLDITSVRVDPPFDFDKARAACEGFVGEHDFSAFCCADTAVTDKVRTIFEMDLKSEGEGRFYLTVTGNGFLYNMVRILTGTIIEIGQGRLVRAVGDIIASGKREWAGRTMPPQGLILKKVEY